jgi:hypothetical protein
VVGGTVSGRAVRCTAGPAGGAAGCATATGREDVGATTDVDPAAELDVGGWSAVARWTDGLATAAVGSSLAC